jgi:glycosyltransferase involved in cell wall biosynthesis
VIDKIKSGENFGMGDLPHRYVVVSPVRDEEKYIELTVQSMISQSIKPMEWVIVNDGSTDRTGEIIDKYAAQYDWIHAFHRADRGYRKAGGGVVDAFYDGYGVIRQEDWDFIVKFDGDLFFGETYFESCFEEFANNPKLGIGGGTIYSNVDGKYILEECPSFHVRGATKIYRRKCWIDMGELIRAPGWDTVDEIKANMLGWETRSFSNVHLYQERVTGGAEGKWKDHVKHGLANYIAGYHPVFMILKCLKRLFNKPRIIGSIALMTGFIKGYISDVSQVDDDDLIKYIRQQQMNRLLFRKSLWKY